MKDILKEHPIVAVWLNSSLRRSMPDLLELTALMADAYGIDSSYLSYLKKEKDLATSRIRRVSARAGGSV